MCIFSSQAKPYVYLSDCKHGGLTSADGQAPEQLLLMAALQDRDGEGVCRE